VEREARAFRPIAGIAAGSAAAVCLAVLVGILVGAPVTYSATIVVLLCLGGAAWLSSPTGTGSRDMTRWLLFAGYIVGSLHAVAYLIPLPLLWAVRTEIATHALFSLFFSAAVTWQAWEHERAVRLFSRTLEELNQPLTLEESLDRALRLVGNTLRLNSGWVLLRQSGRGGAEGIWTLGAAMGFPDWAMRGVHAVDHPIQSCLCLRPVHQVTLVSTMGDLPCVRLSDEEGHRAGRHITIPLGANGQVQGIMVLVVGSNRHFAPADVELLTAMGEQIGLAIDRARAYDEVREKEEARGRLVAQLITAQEDERRRIARELHDETGQALTALVVNLDFLVRHPTDEATTRKRLADVRNMAEDTLAEVRRVIHEMRPTVLDDLGLEAAIRWLMKRYEPSGLDVALDLEGLEQRLPGHVEITVFRLVQEACTNTVKHAKAKRLEVRVIRQGSTVTVQVEDDGQGIGPAQLKSPAGIGLAGLKERVALAGGSLSISALPGSGTRLCAELPLGAEA
jgi:signal transduction histidine kinase